MNSLTFVDTNFILNWFLDRNLKQSREVDNLLQTSARDSLIVDRVTMAEVTYVLRSRDYDHTQVTTVLREFCRHNAVKQLGQVEQMALHIFEETRLDFEDCWLIAAALKHKAGIASFDKALMRKAKSLGV